MYFLFVLANEPIILDKFSKTCLHMKLITLLLVIKLLRIHILEFLNRIFTDGQSACSLLFMTHYYYYQ